MIAVVSLRVNLRTIPLGNVSRGHVLLRPFPAFFRRHFAFFSSFNTFNVVPRY
jgi:hypothetical protein